MTITNIKQQPASEATVTRTPRMIAIGGPSCSGKTTLARMLADHWGEERATLVSLDRYYRDLSELNDEQRSLVNFDKPDSLDDVLLLRQIRRLAKGDAVELPTYDFATHTRGDATDRLEPPEFVIVEGLFTHFWPALCKVMHVRVYLDIDHDTALERRIGRDTRERGRTEESVRTQWRDSVAPMQSIYIEPTRSHADLVICGRQAIEHMKQTFLTFFCEELDR